MTHTPAGAACLDPTAVAEARETLSQHPTVSIPYHSKLSGKTEVVRLMSDGAAETIAGRLDEFAAPLPVKIMMALASAELCEADVVTLTGAGAEDVPGLLEELCAARYLMRRDIGGAAHFKTDTMARPKLLGGGG